MVIPAKFHEANPEYIVVAYEKYIDKTPDCKKVSVTSKLASLDYHTPYDLFHDLKVACGVEIVKHAVGSSTYKSVDLFFHKTTNLLLNEVDRLGLTLFQEKEREDEEDMLDTLREDFERISKNRLHLNQEVVTYFHKHEEPVMQTYNGLHDQSPPPPKVITQPLFSGLVGRSVLDTRNTTVPDPYLVAKVLASAPAADSGVMKSFNYAASRMPPPGTNTQVLDNFFHPNWYTVESPTWLTYKRKTLTPPMTSTLISNPDTIELRTVQKNSTGLSFAPTNDLGHAVVSLALKLSVWFNDIGYGLLKAGEKTDVKSGAEAETNVTAKPDAQNENQPSKPTSDDEDEPKLPTPKSDQIKVLNLVNYSPEAVNLLEELKQEKELITSVQSLQRVISTNLMKLQKLRQKRYLQSTDPSVPSALEVAHYKKITKLLTYLVDLKAAEGKQINLPISKKLPVLLNDYPGVLPGSVSAKAVLGGKTGRLASIRNATYKKKGRFL